MNSVMVGHRADRVAFGFTLWARCLSPPWGLLIPPPLPPPILGVSVCEFAQQILRGFIDDSWQNHFDFGLPVSPRVAPQTRSPFLPQPEDLAGLCARRN